MILSICIPTYNRPDDLKNCLNSIASQNLKKNLEVCISDNCSKYRINKIIKKFKNKINIKYKKNKKNLGFAMNVLKVSLMARGKFIWFLGDDDLIAPNSIKYLINLLKKKENKSIDFFFINSFYLDKSYLEKFKHPFNTSNLPKSMKTHSPVKHNRIVNFFDLIDHRICFDFLLGFYVNCFKRELWLKNLHVVNKKLMMRPAPGPLLIIHVFLLKYFVLLLKIQRP